MRQKSKNAFGLLNCRVGFLFTGWDGIVKPMQMSDSLSLIFKIASTQFIALPRRSPA